MDAKGIVTCDEPACGRPIVFVVSKKSGKKVPLTLPEYRGLVIPNTAAAKADAKAHGWRVVTGYTEDGENKTVAVVGAMEDVGGVWSTVRETHFVDCPARNRFRRA